MDTSPIATTARSPEFRRHLAELLLEICALDTTLRPDVAALREAESAVFDAVERALGGYGLPGVRHERVPIDPAIERHPFYSQPYYARPPGRTETPSAAQAYAGRANLLVLLDGEAAGGPGVGQALNAHIDVVPPYSSPRREGEVVHGRGACDDKGNVVVIVGALKLLGEWMRTTGRRLRRPLTAMIVIDEEMGGNGSLSLAIDRNLKRRYDSMLVLECADGGIYPGNRGCVWYRIEARIPGANLFEASFFVVEELEKEGRALRAESAHPLFPHRPVQTCHGILGNSGEHPARINGDITFAVQFANGAPGAAAAVLRDVLEDGLKQYVGLYGDKTLVKDAAGRPKVDHHYDLTPVADGFLVRVLGSTGHMGAMFENDGAITKMAAMGRAVLRSRAAIEAAAGASMTLALHGWPDSSHLVMEGGQGFLPTHAMDDVQRRVREAARRGLRAYLDAAGRPLSDADALRVSFEKLHNAAFAGDADSSDMRHAIEAAKQAGFWNGGPVRGWDVSCDARIFACEYPGLPVITAGAGVLGHAHSDAEQIDLRDVAQAAEFVAYYILQQTGTV